MNIFKVLLLTVIIAVAYMKFSKNYGDIEKISGDKSQLQISENSHFSYKAVAKTLPDYDPRKRLNKITFREPTLAYKTARYNADDVIEKTSVELAEIQQGYIQAQGNRAERKKLEAEAKQAGMKYKKALLEKLKSGEL